MKLVTAAEMRELEQGSVALGVSLDALMDNAGRALAAEIRGLFSGRPGSALVLVGPGNNGGDGLVCAESLRAGGWKVSLVLAPQKPRDTQRFPVLRAVPPLAEVPQAPADVIVDAARDRQRAAAGGTNGRLAGRRSAPPVRREGGGGGSAQRCERGHRRG